MALVKYNNNSISAITTAGTMSANMILIKEQTASSSASISFVDGSSGVVLDSTYPIYLLKYINVHPASDGQHFYVNFRDGDSSYDATKTTTYFEAEHGEDGSGGQINYVTASDLAQGTGVQRIAPNVGADADQSCSGELFLFNPSSTTFVKHFIIKTSTVRSDNIAFNTYVAGYCNVTAAIDAVQFSFGSGNIDAGTFKLYGIKDS
ncbi:hypothetical protein HTVC034P_gp36 [Pelagibacter phage HTVC034P]|nr:hypothetical protein HTVC034P_gp36 [Pelagibacter phage HTVC034P]